MLELEIKSEELSSAEFACFSSKTLSLTLCNLQTKEFFPEKQISSLTYLKLSNCPEVNLLQLLTLPGLVTLEIEAEQKIKIFLDHYSEWEKLEESSVKRVVFQGDSKWIRLVIDEESGEEVAIGEGEGCLALCTFF